MNRLPDEVLLHILTYLEVADLTHLQSLSHRYLRLGRDNAVWKSECFENSRAEALRRRKLQLDRYDAQLAQLRNAVTALPGGDLTAWDVSQLVGRSQDRASTDPSAEARIQRNRALANWEPGYPDEDINYYEEYINRHAPITTAWLDVPKSSISDKEGLEATGVGLLHHNDNQRVVAPLDDGSICIWDVSGRTTSQHGGGGKKIAQTKPGLLTGLSMQATTESHNIMTETGAIECVSINNDLNKGYFAVQTLLHEVDLNTLQIVSSRQYPFPITALSEVKERTPLTVGTNLTVHLHDPRDSAFAAGETSSAGELIGGSVYSHATLAQPGPLSILSHDGFGHDDSSIWVAGRFTSLLNYDRRFFPRLRGTIFSGARIASLSYINQPFVPRSLDLLRNPAASINALQDARSQRGTTILAAAEYKGKGSLELYGLPAQDRYQNRQTASASKLLSVAPHGGRMVFSDGDGYLKWVERDGFSHVRVHNINDTISTEEGGHAHAGGIWSSSTLDTPGQGDIVQKILPTRTAAMMDSDGLARPDINQENLLLWTGDGRLGILGFGHDGPLGQETWHDAVEEQALSAEARARHDAERQYGMAMRRALERNANEVRFVRGLGMGFMRD